MLNRAIKMPLKRQKMIAMIQAKMRARRIVPPLMLPERRIFTKTEPAMAAAAPIEISCPFVADVTSVIPIERITSSEAPFRILIKFPERTVFPKLLLLITIEKKLGSRIRLKTTRISRAMIGIAS